MRNRIAIINCILLKNFISVDGDRSVDHGVRTIAGITDPQLFPNRIPVGCNPDSAPLHEINIKVSKVSYVEDFNKYLLPISTKSLSV